MFVHKCHRQPQVRPKLDYPETWTTLDTRQRIINHLAFQSDEGYSIVHNNIDIHVFIEHIYLVHSVMKYKHNGNGHSLAQLYVRCRHKYINNL